MADFSDKERNLGLIIFPIIIVYLAFNTNIHVRYSLYDEQVVYLISKQININKANNKEEE
jgi:hypothetical protein